MGRFVIMSFVHQMLIKTTTKKIQIHDDKNKILNAIDQYLLHNTLLKMTIIFAYNLPM